MSCDHEMVNLRQQSDLTAAISGKAKASFTLGLVSFFVSIFTGIPAIINGLLGLREIRQSSGRLQGKRLAVSGILLGLIGSLASASIIVYGVASLQRSVRKAGMG
jgi:hypothetical protein